MMSFDIKMPDVYRSRCYVCFSNVQGKKLTLFHFNWDSKAKAVSEQNSIVEIYQFC